MKRILFLIALALCFSHHGLAAQTLVAAPVGTTHQVNVSWTNTCPSSMTCTFNVYQCAGAVSACSLTAAVWQLVNASPIVGTSYSTSAVTAGSTYSYFVNALATIGGVAETSPPSNEVAVTVPLGPTAPTVTAMGQ